MTWSVVRKIQIGLNWQFTDPIEGTLFRLTQSGVPFGDSFLISQAQINNDGSIEFYDTRLLPVSETIQVLQLISPSYFTKRALAFKRIPSPPALETVIRNTVNDIFLRPQSGGLYSGGRGNWAISVEVNDAPLVDQLELLRQEVGNINSSVMAITTTLNVVAQQVGVVVPEVAAIAPELQQIEQKISQQQTSSSNPPSSTQTPQSTATKYWRIRNTNQATGSGYWACRELIFKDSNGNDITTGGVASASSSNPQSPPDGAFDKNTSTWWGDATQNGINSWLQYTFAANVDVQSISINNLNGYGNIPPTAYAVENSFDNSTWNIVWSFTTGTNDNQYYDSRRS